MRATLPFTLAGVIAFLPLAPSAASGQAISISLDLAGAGGTLSVPVGRELQIRLINRLVEASYHVSVERVRREIPPLDPVLSNVRRSSPCTAALQALERELRDQTTEVGVRTVVQGVTPIDDCPLQDRIRALTTSRAGLESYSLTRGEELRVQVTRGEAKWTFVLSTGDRGSWKTKYGFLFVGDQDEEYFARSGDNPDEFIISKKRDVGGLDFLPALLFEWRGAEAGDVDVGFTGGVGSDLTEVSIIAGLAVTFHQNLSFTGGLAVDRRTRLNGRYTVGDVITEALEPEQLQTTVWGPNFYFGLSLLLGKNPFAGSDGGDSDDGSD